MVTQEATESEVAVVLPDGSLKGALLVTEQERALPPSASWLAYLELSKPRIMILILLISMAGFGMATRGEFNYGLFCHMSLGVSLLAAGVGALNQFYERNIDGLMRRTERRPLPAGRISAGKAFTFGIITSTLGITYLAATVNPLTAVLGIFTLISYVFIYTPLKRKTSLSTVIGAFPGAIPPMIGWTAVHGELSIEPIILFLIMFFWQFPHFLAIAWMYREDYARAGICMLPVVESTGVVTGRQIVLYAVGLLPVSLLPTIFLLTGKTYFFGALILGLIYLYFGAKTAIARTGGQAKRLLQVSILYLPLLFILMLLDKIAR